MSKPNPIPEKDFAHRVYNSTPPPRGRPQLPDDQGQTERIAERVTPAVKAEYLLRGGKAWLVRTLSQK